MNLEEFMDALSQAAPLIDMFIGEDADNRSLVMIVSDGENVAMAQGGEWTNVGQAIACEMMDHKNLEMAVRMATASVNTYKTLATKVESKNDNKLS